ncbi:MAG TPA: radical SAM protein [Thermoanaerobaculia bacterium]|jgi:MoaA/NifB/PqqE/SkfB family radical SAM enzyme|nr:radical SAM protein [Thermoanaerobaculia bacterium]
MNPFRATHPPVYAQWEITRRCNTSCLHCCSESGREVDAAGELSTLEALGLLGQLADARLPVLTLTGGEPLLRDDWSQLARKALSLGIGVNLATNGALITEETADEIARLSLGSVTVGLDSHLPGVHDRIRQWPGLFDQAVAGIRRLAARNVRVVIGFTPHRLNMGSARPLLELARELGAAAVSVTEFVVAGRASAWLALSGAELRASIEEWERLRKTADGPTKIILQDLHAGLPCSDPRVRETEGCGAGRVFLRIRPDGSITPCAFLASPSFSLRREPLSGILDGLASQRPGPANGFCADCEQRLVALGQSEGYPRLEALGGKA